MKTPSVPVLTAAPQVREQRNAVATVAILTAMLLVVALLTLNGWRTARTHERAVNAALRSYATFAAALYRERVEALVYQALTPMRVFASTRAADRGPDLPSARALHDSVGAAIECKCRTVLAPNYTFRLDLRSGRFEAAGDSAVSPDMRRWIAAGVATALKHYQRTQTYASLVNSADRRTRLVYYSVRRNSEGEPVIVYGMEASRASLDSMVFAEALKEAMLQGMVAGDSIPNDTLISVEVKDSLGVALYRTPTVYAPLHTGKETIMMQGGVFPLSVALNPAVAPRLLVGGVPRSQLPLLVGLLGLTAALVVGAVRLTWHTSALARMRADFTSSVSHELRTPITQIMLFAETIALGRVRTLAEARREARVITEEGRRLLDLIENVLHFARSERYELPINRQLTDLSGLVRQTVADFEPIAATAGVTLKATLEDAVGARIDGPAVQRSLRNVLDNAIKYAAVGREAHVGLVLMGARASIWVDDRGPGVPPADRERVWGAFVRLERDMNQATGGSGIGLAVVRDIVVRHGGAVRIEEAPSGGARFVMEFPEASRLGPRAVPDETVRDVGKRA
jgi:signal transduction histidine kinase